MYNRYDYEWDRDIREVERRLLREVSTPEPMSWRKFGKMIQLGVLLRSRERRFWGNWY